MGMSFVNDSSLNVTSDYVPDTAIFPEANIQMEVEHLVQRLSALGQHWQRLLFTKGGP
jgi:hypothetical protein